MTVFTFSNARQNFASLLDMASKSGEVLIKRHYDKNNHSRTDRYCLKISKRKIIYKLSSRWS